jgi:hypothetical protein
MEIQFADHKTAVHPSLEKLSDNEWMDLLDVANKKQVAVIAKNMPPPHPLELNRNEGRWLNTIAGPIDGWFSFQDHGNPPFGVPVQIAMAYEAQGQQVLVVGAGIRTNEIGLEKKEVWSCWVPFEMRSATGKLVFWRPLSKPPVTENFPHIPSK